MGRTDSHQPALDGLRGMAAYMVVISHVSNATGIFGGVLGRGGGQVGVMIFFVLSGYLMGSLYLDEEFTATNVRNYAVRRFARVVPLFYAVVSIALVVYFLSNGDINLYALPLERALGHYAFFDGVGILWTIPVEIHFYVLFVGFWWLHSRSPRVLIPIFVLAIAAYWALPLRVPLDPRPSPYYLVFFLCGLLVSRSIRMQTSQPTRQLWLTIVLIAGFLSPFLLYPGIYSLTVGADGWLLTQDLQQMWHDPRYPLAAALCLVAAIVARPIRSVLSHPIAVQAGGISYSVYLLHLPVIDLLVRFVSPNDHPLLFAFIALIATTFLSMLMYRFFESPMRRNLVRWLSSATASKASVATVGTPGH